MDIAINYILESGISLALLTTIYALFLRKETFFGKNRMFLLGSMLFSVVLPLVRLPSVSFLRPVMLHEVTVTPYNSVISFFGKYSEAGQSATYDLLKLMAFVYLTVALFYLLRLLYRISQIRSMIRKNEVVERDGYKIVYVDSYFSPFSFLNYIFVSRTGKNNADTQKMLLHELEHIRQGHTIDILLLEVLTIFQWFNPFLWMLKMVVRENHEFLADRGVLQKGVSRGVYKQLLLNQYVGQQYIISNSFNYSLIKKRMKMMSKIRSSKLAGIKYLLGFVTAALLLFTFSCEQNNALPRKDKPVFFIVEEMPEFPGGEEALHNFVSSNVKYPDEAKEKGIQGRVFVAFTISDNGKVVDAKVVRGVDPSLDKEALRVINAMPAWKPGKQRGVPVNVQFTVPINFALN